MTDWLAACAVHRNLADQSVACVTSRSPPAAVCNPRWESLANASTAQLAHQSLEITDKKETDVLFRAILQNKTRRRHTVLVRRRAERISYFITPNNHPHFPEYAPHGKQTSYSFVNNIIGRNFHVDGFGQGATNIVGGLCKSASLTLQKIRHRRRMALAV